MFPEVQWLKLHTSTARSMGLIPGWGTKILHAMQRGKKKEKMHYDTKGCCFNVCSEKLKVSCSTNRR